MAGTAERWTGREFESGSLLFLCTGPCRGNMPLRRRTGRVRAGASGESKSAELTDPVRRAGMQTMENGIFLPDCYGNITKIQLK